MDFRESLVDFKSTDVDPRELIMLYKADLMLTDVNLTKHFLPMETKAEFGLAKHIEGVKYREQRKDINVASYLDHSKLVITQILEHKNRLFVADLLKNRAKLVELLYSKYSPYADYVRKQKGGVALLDIVKFI